MTTLPDINHLKDEISDAWLGHSGVAAVGVRADDRGDPLVVISLEGDDPEVVSRLKEKYSGRPVVVETNSGPIEFRTA